MHLGKFIFGSIEIDGEEYEHDLVIDRGRIHRRKKKASRKFREQFGHTPLSLEEKIPWKCRRLIVGSGKYGALPVMNEVKLEARRRDVDIRILPTDAAIKETRQESGARVSFMMIQLSAQAISNTLAQVGRVSFEKQSQKQ